MNFFEFIDGASNVNKYGSVVAGVGGFIKDIRGETILFFSRPIRVTSPYEAELGALKALLELMERENWQKPNLMIYTDNKNVEKHVLFLKASCSRTSRGWSGHYGFDLKNCI